MYTMTGGKMSFSFSSMAWEKDEPASILAAHSASAVRSFSLRVCSMTMFSARMSETPAETMVASWREVTAKSFLEGSLARPLISMFLLRPVPAERFTSSVGMAPIWVMRATA